jgi:TRAP-type C4-dicarboxylate transport system substrate-binding protein
MKIVATTIVAACVLASPLGAVPAPHVIWKLATVAPTGSLWHKALTDMASTWSGHGRPCGATVFPNSGLGGEAAVVRNMRSGQIEASLLMLSGLGQVDDGFNALGIPSFFKNDAEATAVLEALTPLLEKRIAAKGFHLVAWTNGGWVQLFSTTQLKTLADIKKAKLWTSGDDIKMVQWYKTNGFNPAPMDAKDVAPGLKIGTINATPRRHSAPACWDCIVTRSTCSTCTWVRCSERSS